MADAHPSLGSRCAACACDPADVNYGWGLHDIYPCPLKPVLRDDINSARKGGITKNGWSGAGGSKSCDPSTCTGAPKFSDPYTWGCYECDTKARTGYVRAIRSGVASANVGGRVVNFANWADVCETNQRWESNDYVRGAYMNPPTPHAPQHHYLHHLLFDAPSH